MATSQEQYNYYSTLYSNISNKIERIESAKKSYESLRNNSFAEVKKSIDDFYNNLNKVGSTKKWEGQKVRDTKGYYKDNVCKYANKQEEIHDLMIREFSDKLTNLRTELSTAESNKTYWKTQVDNENNNPK